MKKLTKVLMVGALALTGFAGIGAFEAKPAAAAEKPVQYANSQNDPWGIHDTNILSFVDDMTAEQKAFLKPSYQSGSWFTILLPWDAAHYNGTSEVKIFHIQDNGELLRIKTFGPQEVYDDAWKTVFQTQFNSNYPPGKYVAVIKIGDKYKKSDWFTVNK